MDSYGEVVSVVEWTKFLSRQERSYKDFIDKFLAYTQELFFGKKLNRIPEDSRKFLQLSPEISIGNSFLFRNYKIVKVYGSKVQPYKLPLYLLPQIFSLEFLR